MKKFKLSMSHLAVAGVLAMALVGCDDDDQAIIPPEITPPIYATSIEQLNLDVIGSSFVNGHATVQLMITNEDDLPVKGINNINLKRITQLTLANEVGAGESARWEQIFDGPKTVPTTPEYIQNEDGSYTFNVELTDKQSFSMAHTQRFNFIVEAGETNEGLSYPHTEYTEDTAADGSDALYTKNIVAADTCSQCHSDLTRKHENYRDLETCITCHTPDFAEEKDKAEIDFRHLVHNVHNNTKAYEMSNWGEMVNISEGAERIMQNNCLNCHETEATPELPEALYWASMPSMEACSSCHATVDFKAGIGHSTQVDNSNCIACHNTEQTIATHTAKVNLNNSLTDTYTFDASFVVNADTQIGTLKVGLLDSQQQPVELTDAIIAQIRQIEATFNVGPNATQLAWEQEHMNLVLNGQAALANATKAADGKFITIENNQFVYQSAPLTALTNSGQDTDTAFVLLGMSLCHDGKAIANCASDQIASDSMAIRSTTLYASTNDVVSQRHIDSVSTTKCNACHTQLHNQTDYINGAHHAGYIFDKPLAEIEADKVGIAGCATCHGAEGTPAWANDDYGFNYGAIERKVHEKHSHYYHFIGDNCAACHDSFNFDALAKKQAIVTYASYVPTDTKYSTPLAAICTSCHVPGSDNMKFHSAEDLNNKGAVFNGSKEDVNAAIAADSESNCLACHRNISVDNHSGR